MRWIAAVALAWGCGSRGPDAAQVRREMDQQLAQLSALSCARPVLRGTPLPGPAGDDIDAVTAQDGSPLAACIDRWAPLNTTLSELCKPYTAECVSQPVPDEQRVELDAIIADCGELTAAAIARATGHADGCTPHPDAMLMVSPTSEGLRRLAIAKLADRAAQALVASGHALQGVQRMLDVLALANDWSRGGGGMLAAATSAAVIKVAADYARVAIRVLSPDELAEIADEVDRVAVGLPRLYDTLASDAVVTTRDSLQHDAAHVGRVWRDAQRSHAPLVSACPVDATVGACITAVNSLPIPNGDSPMPVFAPLVRTFAVSHVEVYELALEVAVRRLGHCPTDADWTSAPLAARLDPPALGIAMTATAEANGVWRIDAPASLAHKRDKAVTLARITCP